MIELLHLKGVKMDSEKMVYDFAIMLERNELIFVSAIMN